MNGKYVVYYDEDLGKTVMATDDLTLVMSLLAGKPPERFGRRASNVAKRTTQFNTSYVSPMVAERMQKLFRKLSNSHHVEYADLDICRHIAASGSDGVQSAKLVGNKGPTAMQGWTKRMDKALTLERTGYSRDKLFTKTVYPDGTRWFATEHGMQLVALFPDKWPEEVNDGNVIAETGAQD